MDRRMCEMHGCNNPAIIYYTESNVGKNEFSESFRHEIYLCKNCTDLERLENVDKIKDWEQWDCEREITCEYTLYIYYQFVPQD